MTRLALLCSGQGFQHPGMFALTAEAAAAAPVFAAATTILGRDPRELAERGEGLHDNANAQVLCCTQALAAVAALGDTLGDADVVVAGYSVGELAAWGVAGVFDAPTTLALARRRAAVMDQAAAGVGGGLAAIRGLPRDRVETLCREHDTHVAIVNGTDQIVVGGATDALEAVLAAAQRTGSEKVTMLAVPLASHTPLLKDAAGPLGEALRQAESHDLPSGRRLLSGIDGDSVFDVAAGLDKLARQVAQTIDWHACMEECRAAGVTRALELGPGRALAHLMTAHLDTRDCRALDDFRTVDGVRRWLAAD